MQYKYIVRNTVPNPICSDQIFHEWKDSPLSVLPIYSKLISAGLRVWVYRYVCILLSLYKGLIKYENKEIWMWFTIWICSGDADGRVPVLGTRYCLESLGLPTVGPWRPWYHEKQVLSSWINELAVILVMVICLWLWLHTI